MQPRRHKQQTVEGIAIHEHCFVRVLPPDGLVFALNTIIRPISAEIK